jgi:hypothetical protein
MIFFTLLRLALKRKITMNVTDFNDDKEKEKKRYLRLDEKEKKIINNL